MCKNETIELLRDKNLPLLELKDILKVALEIEFIKCVNKKKLTAAKKKQIGREIRRERIKNLKLDCEVKLCKTFDKIFLESRYDEL